MAILCSFWYARGANYFSAGPLFAFLSREISFSKSRRSSSPSCFRPSTACWISSGESVDSSKNCWGVRLKYSQMEKNSFSGGSAFPEEML